jgi:hypothetical protein
LVELIVRLLTESDRVSRMGIARDDGDALHVRSSRRACFRVLGSLQCSESCIARFYGGSHNIA